MRDLVYPWFVGQLLANVNEESTSLFVGIQSGLVRPQSILDLGFASPCASLSLLIADANEESTGLFVSTQRGHVCP